MALIDGIVGDVRSLRMLPDRDQVAPLIDIVTALADPALARRVVLDVVRRRAVPRAMDDRGIRALADAAGLPVEVLAEGIERERAVPGTALLEIHAPRNLDPYAHTAARLTRAEYERRLAARRGRRLAQRGISGTVERVTERFNSVSLDDPRLLALAQAAVYETLFLDALDVGRVDPADVAGNFDHIATHLEDEALAHLLTGVVTAVLEAEGIALDPVERDDVVRLAVVRGLPLGSGRPRPAVLKLVETRRRQGDIPLCVAHYLDTPGRREIAADAVDEETRQAMIDYLVGLRLTMTYDKVVDGAFDEYLALSYDHARRQRGASEDPLDVARGRGRSTGAGYDFTVPRFSDRRGTTVRPAAVRAAGALFSVFVQGELMRLFDLADSLVLEWHRGSLDVSEGEFVDRLHRYEHLRDDRLDDEERGMLYRRLLGFGQAEVLSGSIVNERFGEHLDTLMYEVTRLVDLQDRAFNDPRQISRAGIGSAITTLQDNLSRHLTGSAFVKIRELVTQLTEAQALIEDDVVIIRYGGVEQNPESVVRNLGMRCLDVSIPAVELSDLAYEGGRVFEFVSEFTPGVVREESFQHFLAAAKRVIIARAAIGGDEEPQGYDDEAPDSGYGRRRRGPRDPYTEPDRGRTGDEWDDWDR